MVVDVLVLIAAVLFGWLGWAEGMLRAVWGFAGMMLGATVGIVLVPRVFHEVDLSIWISLGAVFIVGIAAAVGRSVTLAVHGRVRDRIGWRPPALVDHPAGAVFGVGATLMVSWMLGLAVAGSTLPILAPATNQSVALRALNSLGLPFGPVLVDHFVDVGRRADFPRYVDALTAETITPVAAPDERSASGPAVRSASASVWRVVAGSDGLTAKQGTAFAVAPQRVMTAAHVVTAATWLVVETEAGDLDATVVACDAEADVAVLEVPELQESGLPFVDVAAGDPAVVAGFPNNGDLTLGAARVREHLRWQSADVYGDGRYERDGYTVRGSVQSGNSGGPLLTEDGAVAGVVVASSRVDKQTGYVLSRHQVEPLLDPVPDVPRSCPAR